MNSGLAVFRERGDISSCFKGLWILEESLNLCAAAGGKGETAATVLSLAAPLVNDSIGWF